MERKPTRGTKSKNVPLPGSLITLGNKTASRPEGEKSSTYAMGKGSSGGAERGRDGPSSSGMHSKKPMKAGGSYIMGLSRPNTLGKPSLGEIAGVLNEEWETVAEEVESSELLLLVDASEAEEDYDRTEALICGAIKSLKIQRAKPDMTLCFNLLVLARYKPAMFNRRSGLVVDALCSLLKKDYGYVFKSKSNPTVSVVAANILLYVFMDDKNWPEVFIRAYIDDSLGERVWVDLEECKGFVDNFIASFRTKMPPKNNFFPDLSIPSNRPECPSPTTVKGDLMDCDSEMLLECKENLDVTVCNRFGALQARVDEIIVETVHNQMGLRHQNVDSVARNFIKFLSSVAGIVDIRRVVAPRLEAWLQSPKLQRHATELLMSICLNCNTYGQSDIDTINAIIRIKIKNKPAMIMNQYFACLKELLAAHPDNILTAIHTTIHNELSAARNPCNMNIIPVIFMYSPEIASLTLADEFLKLLSLKDDFHRALRLLFREIVRALRHDVPYLKFCEGLMKEKRCSNAEISERMFYGITDLISMVLFAGISPVVKENTTQKYRGEVREVDTLRRYQEMVACVQQSALNWMLKVVPKCYAPGKDEYQRALHKILLMDLPEAYAIKDNWPGENERAMFCKIASDVPLKQDTLMNLLMIAVTKEQYVKPQELMDLADKLIKRATLLQMDDQEVFHVDDPKIIDLIFNLSLYIMPENTQLPHNFTPPRMAIVGPYWKCWIMLLLITAHNPSIFGRIVWEPAYSYHSLRMLMEMCITNSFVFPPPTLMSGGKKSEDMITQEHMLFTKDKEIILEFEEYLAQKQITEQNSLLLSQLITMDIKGPARKPPPGILEGLKALNTSHRIGHLLCRSRNPDFLLDIITRQGTSQSMPWLAELVQNHENAFSMLPVQCLCEFLLSETSTNSAIGDTLKHQQLVHHLRTLLRTLPQPDDSSSLEILEYFLRRLSCQQAGARGQAIKGLQRLLHPSNADSEKDLESGENHSWLMQHLTMLPTFKQVRNMANQSIRAAMQVETEPSIVSAYLRFLAVHTNDDSVQEQTGLVSDLAQVIVERCTICNAILPLPEKTTHFVHAHSTLKAFFIIFINYMRVVKVPVCRETFSWSDNQDQVRVQWANGDQAVMQILVIHSIVILLTYGPHSCQDLFNELMAIWFPEQIPMAFLVDTSEEALLFPDWLKLRMIRSTVPRLVDAAVKDLEPNQLVLFIQSFGIPVASMSRLLAALDDAVVSNPAVVNAAVLDKSHKAYMAQLLEVQQSRGAVGGEAFGKILGEQPSENLQSTVSRRRRSKPLMTEVQMYHIPTIDISVGELRSFITQCFTVEAISEIHKPSVSETMRAVERHLGQELSSDGDKPYTTELLDALYHCLQNTQSNHVFVKGLHTQYDLSAPLFRLLLRLVKNKDKVHLRPCLHIVTSIQKLDTGNIFSHSPLSSTLNMFPLSDSSLDQKPPIYEPQSSPFSIANLAGPGPTKIIKPKADVCSSSQVARYSLESDEAVLMSLVQTPGPLLEQHIRNLFEAAVKSDKLSVVRSALAKLIAMNATDVVKVENNKLSRRSMALLLDWLFVLDPELQESSLEVRNTLLFSRYKDQPVGIGVGGYSQAYLLGAFTQQANWNSLEKTVLDLLKQYDESLNPGGVLDFIHAVMTVPKLWQGREKRQPRHVKKPIVIQFRPKHLLTLAEYMLGEKALVPLGGKAEDRVKMLMDCYGDNRRIYNALIGNLCSMQHRVSDEAKLRAGKLFLYELYVCRPNILSCITPEANKVMACVARTQSVHCNSSADAAIHCLITMISSPNSGRDFKRRLHELDAALRTLAANHPLLILRQFHLIHTGLDGISHLNIQVLKNSNHLEVLHVFIGVLELLHPHLFSPKFNDSFTATLDCYFSVYEAHGSPTEMSHTTNKLVDLLHSWLATDRPRALNYLVPKTDLLKCLSKGGNEWRSLSVIASASFVSPTDVSSADDDPAITAPPLPTPPTNWLKPEADEVARLFLNAQTGDESREAWHRLNYLANTAPTQLLVQRFTSDISLGLNNFDKSVRDVCWTLAARMLVYKPTVASEFEASMLRALKNEECSIAKTAVERLPDVILMMHGSSTNLLTASFCAVTTKTPNSLSCLNKALSLLTVHKGA